MMTRNRLLLTAGIAALAVLAVAAVLAVRAVRDDGGDRFLTAPPPLPAGTAVRDGLILVRDQRLILRSMRDGKEYTLKETRLPGYYNFPRWSPDGGRLAYTIEAPPTGAADKRWGSSVAVSAPDGSEERIVLSPRVPGESVYGLAWLPAGDALLISVATPRVENARAVGQTLVLERLEIASGRRSPVMNDAAFPTVTRDGARVAFIAYGAENQPAGLWTAAADGGDRRLLVRLPDEQNPLPTLLYPRYSPDGARIAFAAVDAVAGAAAPSPGRAWRWPWQPRPASAHGLPMDVYVIPAGGGTPERLTSLNEDEPSPAWSPDGARLAIMATGGLYELTPADRKVSRLGPGAFGGQADWR